MRVYFLFDFSIQIAVDATIPETLGGVGGEAVYIDTEGSFIIERVADIAKATSEHCRRMAKQDGSISQEFIFLHPSF
jgi:RecA/RadA recombinase